MEEGKDISVVEDVFEQDRGFGKVDGPAPGRKGREVELLWNG